MENPNDKAFFQELYRLTEENNIILRKMRSSQRLSQIVQFGYIFFFVILGAGSLYFIKPYLNQVLGMYGGGEGSIGGIQTLIDSYSSLQDLQ